MATTLLTGATGLIGAHLVGAWGRGALLPISHSEVDLLVPGTMAELVLRHRPATVVHLAWCASGSPDYRDAEDNAAWLDRSTELIVACREARSHLVLAGTVLDDGTGTDAYARAKSALRIVARDATAKQALTWVRPHYVFDPERGRPQLVADALASARSQTAVELTDPHAQHDFVHAADVASALLLVLERQILGEVDIGSAVLHEVRQVVEALHIPWTTNEAGPTLRLSSPVADIHPLLAQGWEPRQTRQFFGEPREVR